MKKITFVTSNKTKLEDARNKFIPYNIEIVGKKIDLPEIQTLIQEDAVSKKAQHAFEKLKRPLFVDDTSFYIKGYKNFPGTLTKYINQALGLSGLSKLYKEGQEAYFLTIIYYIDGTNRIITKGTLRGKLTKKISTHFNQDTPLSSVFIPRGYQSPLIELDQPEVGNLHRIRALKQLLEKLKKGLS